MKKLAIAIGLAAASFVTPASAAIIFENETPTFVQMAPPAAVANDQQPDAFIDLNEKQNISLAGNVIVDIASPILARTFTLATAVPEPGTWGLMLFGFGTIGFAMRRTNTMVTSFV